MLEKIRSFTEGKMWKIYLRYYDDILDKFIPRIQLFEEIEEVIFKHGHKIILDCGCGSGFFLRRLKRRDSGLELVGIDSSVELIKKAIDFNLNIKYFIADLDDDLPVADNYFDTILSVNTIYLLKKIKITNNNSQEILSFLDAAYQKLHKGGIMIIITPGFPGPKILSLIFKHYYLSIKKLGLFITILETVKKIYKIIVILIINIIIRFKVFNREYRFFSEDDLIRQLKLLNFEVINTANCYDGSHLMIQAKKV